MSDQVKSGSVRLDQVRSD